MNIYLCIIWIHKMSLESNQPETLCLPVGFKSTIKSDKQSDDPCWMGKFNKRRFYAFYHK